MKDLKFKGTTLQDCVLKIAVMNDIVFENSNFNEVIIIGDDSWGFRKKGLNDCVFQNCSFTKMMFNNCTLNDIEIKNVTLSDLQIEGLHLSDLKIDGNEAFLEAIGQISEKMKTEK